MTGAFLEFINSTSGSNPFISFWLLFKSGGWIIIDGFVLWILYLWYIDLIQNRYIKMQKWVMLAIDVPKENEQSFKAVEQIFATVAGAHKDPNLTEKYFEGHFQLSFSFEVVSIDGYIQFIVRAPIKFRNIVESGIYAQYPDAEITEIEDYTKKAPKPLPNEEYELYGAEFIPTNNYFFPIRTWPNFQDSATQTTADPMAAFLEIMSSIYPGEQVWFQLLLTPVAHTWREPGVKIVKKLIGAKVPVKYTGIEKLTYGALNTVGWVGEQTIGTGPKLEEKKKDAPRSEMLFLSEGEKAVVKAVEEKMAKIGYKARIRLLYFGPRKIFDKKRIVPSMIGAIKQFNTQDMGGLKVDPTVTTNKAEYFFTKYRTRYRQRKILKGYMSRDASAGASKGWKVLNIEELATLYHFPLINVKTPLISKAMTKRSEPPSGLPTMAPAALKKRKSAPNPLLNVMVPSEEAPSQTAGEAGAPPSNLPIG